MDSVDFGGTQMATEITIPTLQGHSTILNKLSDTHSNSVKEYKKLSPHLFQLKHHELNN